MRHRTAITLLDNKRGLKSKTGQLCTALPNALRSVKMKTLGVFDFWNSLPAIIAKLPKRDFKNPNDMTQDELREYIQFRGVGLALCNEIMQRSCGDDQSGTQGDFSTWSPYNKWIESGGRCPTYYIGSNNCTSGCRDFSRCY